MMKFTPPTVIAAEYRIVTPMFLGDALQATDDQVFRTASLKGALRFWWRALNWGRLLKTHAGQTEAALKALNAREGGLFGKAGDSQSSTQSLVQLHTELQDSQRTAAGNGLKSFAYLLGQGLYHFRNGVLRPYLTGGSVRLTARFKPGTGPSDIDSVAEALIALGLFGGLGSRARKGFGSLAIQWLQLPGERRDFADLATIEAFIAQMDFSAPANAPLTALTCASRLDASLSGSSSTSVLAAVGEELQLYRDGTIFGQPRRSNFPHDRALALQAAQGNSIPQLPQRAVFGLPHNYCWKTGEKLEIAPKESTRNRRASPLLIHIHQFPNGNCVAIQTLLPGSFLPDKSEVELKGKRKFCLTDPAVDYQVIHRYLDGFKQNKVLRHGQ